MKKIIEVVLGALLIFTAYSLLFANNIPQEIIGEHHLIDGSLDTKILSKGRITLAIDKDGKLEGTSAVNHYGGSIIIKNDSIEFSDIFHTEMASMDPELNELELEYYELLSKINRFEMNDNHLVFLENTDELLIFEKD